MASSRQRAWSPCRRRGATNISALLLASTIALVACRNQPKPAPRVHKQVHGTVTANNHPLAHAQVCAWRRGPRVRAVREDAEPQCTQSDTAGAYTLELEVGVWQLVAFAREHLPHGEALALRASQPPLSLDLSLRPGGRRYGGRLVDLDGNPIADARVDAVAREVGWGISVSAHSDAQGQFELWTAPNASLHVTAPGFTGMVPRADDSFVLLPESVIAGRVVDASGKPVAGARVAHVKSLGPSFGFPLDATRTDAKGAFRLHGLAPDSYFLIAHNDEVGGQVLDVEVEYAQTREGVEISLSTPLQPLRARVVDGDGSPVAGCMVGVALEGGERRGLSQLYAWTDEEGLLNVPSRDSRYQVMSLSCPDRIGVPPYEPLSVGLSGDAIPSLTVGRGQPLRGRLLDAAGDPLANARVWVQLREPDGDDLRPRAEVDDHIDMDKFMPLHSDAVTDSDGRFEVPALPPGVFEIKVDGWDRIGTPPQVTITADTPTEANFTMAAAGHIELRSSRAHAEQAITIQSCRESVYPSAEPWRTSRRTDARGVAIVEHAPPGPLLASLRELSAELRCDDPLSAHFEILAGQTTQVALTAGTPTQTLVRVRSRAGEPVANAVVNFRPSAFLPATSINWWFDSDSFVITDAQGQARFDRGCDDESCSVTAARPGQFATATVAPGQDEVVIEL